MYFRTAFRDYIACNTRIFSYKDQGYQSIEPSVLPGHHQHVFTLSIALFRLPNFPVPSTKTQEMSGNEFHHLLILLPILSVNESVFEQKKVLFVYSIE